MTQQSHEHYAQIGDSTLWIEQAEHYFLEEFRSLFGYIDPPQETTPAATA
jgi:hypothetical protein